MQYGETFVEQLTLPLLNLQWIDYVSLSKISIYLKRLKGRVFYRPLILII
jgi:hypothetical protein